MQVLLDIIIWNIPSATWSRFSAAQAQIQVLRLGLSTYIFCFLNVVTSHVFPGRCSKQVTKQTAKAWGPFDSWSTSLENPKTLQRLVYLQSLSPYLEEKEIPCLPCCNYPVVSSNDSNKWPCIMDIWRVFGIPQNRSFSKKEAWQSSCCCSQSTRVLCWIQANRRLRCWWRCSLHWWFQTLALQNMACTSARSSNISQHALLFDRPPPSTCICSPQIFRALMLTTKRIEV